MTIIGWGNPHPLTANMPLSSFYVPVTMVSLYLTYCFVSSAVADGSSSISTASRNRILFYFNFCRMATQTLVASSLIYFALADGHRFFCTPVPTIEAASAKSSNAANIAWCIWAYYVVKLVDLFDCVSIIQSGAKVNTLQMYHHTTLVFIAWIGLKYCPGGTTIAPIVINSFCQFGFYVYHKINKTRPKAEQVNFEIALYTMQVIQFTLILIYTGGRLFQPCDYPPFASITLALYIVIFAITVIAFWSVPILDGVSDFCGCDGNSKGPRDGDGR